MIKGNSLMAGMTAYSEWQDSEGESATFVCDVGEFGDSLEFRVTVQTKDVGEGHSEVVTATGGAFPTISSVGVYRKRVSGLKRRFRYKYEWSANGEDDEQVVQFCTLRPAWE